MKEELRASDTCEADAIIQKLMQLAPQIQRDALLILGGVWVRDNLIARSASSAQ